MSSTTYALPYTANAAKTSAHRRKQQLIIRHPRFEDGDAIYHLIKSCPPLDLNSPYYYFMMCRDFSATSVVVELDGAVVGFVSAFRRPQAREKLFVWQVAVSPKVRGCGLGKKMVQWIIEQPQLSEVREIETTISPSNTASRNLFASFAREIGSTMRKREFLSEEHFVHTEHEAEDLYIIPLYRSTRG